MKKKLLSLALALVLCLSLAAPAGAAAQTGGPVITVPPTDFEGRVGETAEFTVAAEGVGLQYRWQARTASGTKWSDCSSTADSYRVKISQARLGYVYRCRVSDADGHTVYSPEVRMLERVGPAVTVPPTDYKGSVGDTAVFSLQASGDGLSYRWQARTASGTKWSDCSSTADSYRVTISQTRLGYVYRCRITDADGHTVYSPEVRMLEKKPPVITVPPADFEGRIGEEAVFSVEASGGQLSWQWLKRPAAGGPWSICGSTDSSFRITITQNSLGYVYCCRVTDEDGFVYSPTARITEKSVPVITVQPADFEGRVGGTAVFSVSAAGSGLSWQWQVKTSENAAWKNTTINGYRTDTITVPVTQTRIGYRYRCLITDAAGETVISGEAALKEAGLPVILSGPSDATVALGGTAVFSVSATGDGLSWQWQVKTSENAAWKDTTVSGYQTDTIRVKLTEARVGYRYRCVVTNAAGISAVSGDAQLKRSAQSGNTPARLHWTLSSDGTLTIYGPGAIDDYWLLNEEDYEEPFYYTREVDWRPFRHSIVSIVIEEGVTRIGRSAFMDCSELRSVTIPGSVTHIGDSAFAGCPYLTEVTLPEGLQFLDCRAFADCEELRSVRLPGSLVCLGSESFADPDEWGPPFDCCDALTDLYYAGSEADWNRLAAAGSGAPGGAAVHFAPAP